MVRGGEWTLPSAAAAVRAAHERGEIDDARYQRLRRLQLEKLAPLASARASVALHWGGRFYMPWAGRHTRPLEPIPMTNGYCIRTGVHASAVPWPLSVLGARSVVAYVHSPPSRERWCGEREGYRVIDEGIVIASAPA